MIDVACLISLMELGCLHDENFYSPEGIDEETVKDIRISRRMARHFVRHWDCTYRIWLGTVSEPHDGLLTSLEDIVETMVLAHAQAFYAEVRLSEGRKTQTFAEGCTSAAVLEGLNRHFSTPIFSASLKEEWQTMSTGRVEVAGYRYQGDRVGIITENPTPLTVPDLGEQSRQCVHSAN